MRLNKGDIVRAGHAHMRRPMRGVEGPLYLTKTALFHEGSVGPYIESVETIIDLKDIKEIKTKRSMGLIPNVIKIITHNNDIFKFSVFKREDWITAINKMRKKLYAPAED
ncbi:MULTISPECIES: GRAM domain-containing protein [Jeotgalicoccus]|uniref:GRAM domain-containing protein n=1 Tax=Jeotgalicoccus TaxID=227979 RepID=UPI0030FDB2E4